MNERTNERHDVNTGLYEIIIIIPFISHLQFTIHSFIFSVIYLNQATIGPWEHKQKQTHTTNWTGNQRINLYRPITADNYSCLLYTSDAADE